MVCYFKRICGINQAEDRVTWPDLLHRHTIALASFREWSAVSARLRIRAQPRNPCRARNSASAWTWLSRLQSFAVPPSPTTSRLRLRQRPKMLSPSVTHNGGVVNDCRWLCMASHCSGMTESNGLRGNLTCRMALINSSWPDTSWCHWRNGSCFSRRNMWHQARMS